MNDNAYYLLILELGIAILDKNNTVLNFLEFRDPILSHDRLNRKDMSEVIESLKFFKEKPKKILTNYNELNSLAKKTDFNFEKISINKIKEIQLNKLNLYINSFKLYGPQNQDFKSLTSKLRDFSIKWSSFKIQEASEQLDLHISQSINALDEIDKILNTLGTRMREWYGLHFPELDNLLQNIVTFATIVENSGKRSNITKESLSSLEIPENKIEIILDISKRSRGGKITDENLSLLQDISRQVISLSKTRKNLEEHIETSMQDIAPNLKELLTASVGARLIAKAGSLKRLSSLSSSTIQILGAEKALFRTLKTGSNPPKHGILFQHPVIHSAPKWQRGKLARAISSKAAIAARLDLYGKDHEVSSKLTDKLNFRITEIQEKYKIPTEIQQKHTESRNKFFSSDFSKKKKYEKDNFGGRFRDRDRGRGRAQNRSEDFKKSKFKKRHHKSNKK